MDNPRPQWVLTFDVGKLKCALPLNEVGELVPMAKLSDLPLMPDFVEGILNLAGQEVPVLRLDRLLELSDQAVGVDSVLIIMRREVNRFALVVDNVEDAKQISEEVQFVPFDDDRSFQRCFLADLKFGEQTYHLISVDNLLLAEERERLAEFQRKEEERIETIKEVALAS